MANVVYFNEGIKIPCCPTLLESIYLASSGSCCTDSNTPYTGFVAGNLTYNIIYTLPTTSGTTGQVLTTDGNNNLSWTTVSGGGGSGTPSGTDGLIQYNNGGAFGGATTLYWNDLNSRLGINTSNPNQTLEVAGTMRLTGSTGTPVSIMGRNSSGDIGNITLGSNFILSGGTLSLSGVTVSGYVPYTGATQNVDLNSYNLTSSGVTTPYLQISATGSPTPLQVGMLRYNDTDKTLEFLMGGGNVTQQIGQKLPIPVKHADNAGLDNGKVVYFVNSDGTNKLVRYAIATGETGSAQVIGLMTESAVGGDKALCTTFGMVRDINTSTLQEGQIVWLSATELGGMTTTRPLAPNHGVQIGFCIRQHATEGAIFVSVQNGYEIDELHNVLISSGITNNDLLVYNSALQVWENKQASSANLITGTGTATQIAFWSGATGTTSSALTSSSNLYWDNTNARLGIGTTNPTGNIQIGTGSNLGSLSNPALKFGNSSNGFYLDTNRLFVSINGFFAGGFISTGIIGNGIQIVTNNSPNNLTTPLFLPNKNSSEGLTSGFGGNVAGDLSLITNNLSRIAVLYNGNVGLSTTTPSARLHVVSSNNTNSTWTAQFHNSSGTNNALMIRDDGNVGIGTSGTTARLVVRSTGTTSTTGTTFLIQESGGTSIFDISDSGVVNTKSIVSTSDSNNVGPFFSITPFNINSEAQVTRWAIRTRSNESNRGIGIGAVSNAGAIQGLSTSAGTSVSLLSLQPFTGQLVIGSGSISSNSAIVEIVSTTGGFLGPRMTTAQRDAIVSPATGLELFNTSIGSKQVYNGTEWEILNGARQAITASSSTTSVVFRNGNIADIVLSSSTTLTFSNAAVGTYIVKITQGGSGFNLVSWPANVLWSGGIIPTLTTAVGKTDIFTFVYDSTNYYGSYALNY